MCGPRRSIQTALALIPTVSPSSLKRLCLHAKAGAGPPAGEEFIFFVDSVAALKGGYAGPIELGGATAKWREIAGGGGGAKALMVVLDLSYSMDSDGRLPTCKRSLEMILNEHVNPMDKVGLVTFADDVKAEFALTEAGEVGEPTHTMMLSKVRSMRTRSMTAFYSAVLEGAALVAKELQHGKGGGMEMWLVALTDGADNRSKPGAAQQAVLRRFLARLLLED